MVYNTWLIIHDTRYVVHDTRYIAWVRWHVPLDMWHVIRYSRHVEYRHSSFEKSREETHLRSLLNPLVGTSRGPAQRRRLSEVVRILGRGVVPSNGFLRWRGRVDFVPPTSGAREIARPARTFHGVRRGRSHQQAQVFGGQSKVARGWSSARRRRRCHSDGRGTSRYPVHERMYSSPPRTAFSCSGRADFAGNRRAPVWVHRFRYYRPSRRIPFVVAWSPRLQTTVLR